MPIKTTPKQTTPKAYLTLREGAEFLRCSQRTMIRYILAGKIPFVRLGKRYLLKAEDLGPGMKSSRLSTVEEILA